MAGDYSARKAYFDSLMTLFGRKPVAEALADPDVEPVCLHLAETNRPSAQIERLVEAASARGADIRYHSREALSRISKNRKQDQGVAVDVRAPAWQRLDDLVEGEPVTSGLIAVDGITNPQNLGMIVRAVGGSPRAGLILARRGNAPIDGLVIKASAGTLFRTPVFRCDSLPDALDNLKSTGYRVYGLDASATLELADLKEPGPHVLVFGNETTGLSDEVMNRCDGLISLPMARGIESLNVAVAAGIVAYAPVFLRRDNAAPR